MTYEVMLQLFLISEVEVASFTPGPVFPWGEILIEQVTVGLQSRSEHGIEDRKKNMKHRNAVAG